MTVKTMILTGAKMIALSVYLFLCFAVAAALVVLQAVATPSTVDPAYEAMLLLTVCIMNVGVLSFLILRSRWNGWHLSAVVFVLFYGVMTFMTQIETAFFITSLPSGTTPRLFLMGAIIAALFSPVAVRILGKWSPEPEGTTMPEVSPIPLHEATWKAGVIVPVYLFLYFTFGYFIAWTNPSLRAYYGGGPLEGFGTHMFQVLTNTPSIVVLQIVRALIWTMLALLVIRMMKGPWWEKGLAVALLFSVVMNAQLLLPNAFMPETVRMTHLIETASSNFLFGWFVVWFLHRPTRQQQYSPAGNPSASNLTG